MPTACSSAPSATRTAATSDEARIRYAASSAVTQAAIQLGPISHQRVDGRAALSVPTAAATPSSRSVSAASTRGVLPDRAEEVEQLRVEVPSARDQPMLSWE